MQTVTLVNAILITEIADSAKIPRAIYVVMIKLQMRFVIHSAIQSNVILIIMHVVVTIVT